jgi:hypothetical protein
MVRVTQADGVNVANQQTDVTVVETHVAEIASAIGEFLTR